MDQIYQYLSHMVIQSATQMQVTWNKPAPMGEQPGAPFTNME